MQVGCATAQKMIAQPPLRSELIPRFKYTHFFSSTGFVQCMLRNGKILSTGQLHITHSHVCSQGNAGECVKLHNFILCKQLRLVAECPTCIVCDIRGHRDKAHLLCQECSNVHTLLHPQPVYVYKRSGCQYAVTI